MKNEVVITAAGQARRMKGQKKMLIDLNGKPVIAYTIEPFEKCSEIDGIVLVAQKEDIGVFEGLVKKYGFRKVKHIVPGGMERMESVANGLAVLDKDCDIVLIQDGARPFISEEVIRKVIEAAEKYGAAIVGVTPKDTIQRVSDEGFVEETFNRDKLLAVHTPVAAKCKLIFRAREKAVDDGVLNTPGFEDSALLRRLGLKVKVVLGEYDNIKITTPEDVALAKRILEEKKG